MIKNNKEFLDQSLDEIKLLRYINAHGGGGSENHILQLHGYFYHREHLFIVTELLKDNLYEFQRFLADQGEDPYFTLGRIQRICRQVLTALAFIHRRGLVHCDLKPENILISSYSQCNVKVWLGARLVAIVGCTTLHPHYKLIASNTTPNTL